MVEHTILTWWNLGVLTSCDFCLGNLFLTSEENFRFGVGADSHLNDVFSEMAEVSTVVSESLQLNEK